MKRNLLWEEADKRTYRKPTDIELQHALAIEKCRERIEDAIAVLEDLLNDIHNDTNTVFYDEAGFPYDTRHYIASGRCELF